MMHVPLYLPFFGLPGPDAHLLGAVMRDSEYCRHRQWSVGQSPRYIKRSSYIAARFRPNPVGTPRHPLKHHGDCAPGPQSLQLAFEMSTSRSVTILFASFLF